jgi:hypothetical protein
MLISICKFRANWCREGRAVLRCVNEIFYPCNFESKERLDKVFVLRHGVRHLQSSS